MRATMRNWHQASWESSNSGGSSCAKRSTRVRPQALSRSRASWTRCESLCSLAGTIGRLVRILLSSGVRERGDTPQLER